MRKKIIDFAENNMKRLIEDLPNVEAKVIKMRYLQKFKHGEIAQKLRSQKTPLNKRTVQGILSRFSDRVLGKEGMFSATLRFYNAYLGLCDEHRKFLYRQERDRKRKRQ